MSLARALMAAPRSDVILLDDPFSAVDGHTGESMFFNGVVDALKGKLRVVVMNSHMHLIHSFDKVVMMQDGRVVAVGSPSQLAMSEHAALFAKMTGDMRTHPESKLEAKDENLKQIVTATPDDVASRNNMRKAALLAFHCNSAGESEMNKKGTEPQGNLTGQLIVKEERAKGDIAQSVYITYFSACLWKVNSSIDGLGGPSREMLNRTSFAVGLTLCTLLVFLFATAQAARISVDLLLVRWAQDQNQNNFLIYVSHICFCYML